jgi:ArsR family transcriptional regulator
MFKQFAQELPSGWDEFAGFFAALGDPTRHKILLIFEPREELCVNEIASAFDISRPAISHHLKVLRNANVLTCEKRGKEVYYKVNSEYCANVLKLTQHTAEHGAAGEQADNAAA